MMQRWSNQMADALRTFLRRGALFVMAGVSVGVITLSPLATRPASAAILGDFGLGSNSCAIETVGWVICPTMRTIARLADKGFTYINQSSLSLNYNLFDSSGKTFKGWEVMRNIANGLFVVVFLFIIYRYLMGRVDGSYSLKRLLPRLLIAAIAINLSFYIGVMLVDISNIIGDSIWNIIKSLYDGTSRVLPLGGSANPLEDGNLTKMTAAAMGNTGMVWVLLPLVAAVTITIAVISAATVILIIMREAVVATLLLAAPLLIVLNLLPNTERFAAQGLRLFFQLLILYPIIALLLGVGQIVSLAAGSWSGVTAPYGGGSGLIVPDMVAAAAAVVPLLGVWFIFKNLSSVMSTAGSRLSASVRSRRGEDDKDARVTGKASVGAANAKNATGLGRIMGRRQAFSRNRRRSSLGNSALTNQPDGNSKPGLASQQGNADALKNALTNSADKSKENTEENAREAAEKHLEELQKASIDGQADGMKVDGAAIANAQNNGKEQEKHVTAKDLFNNLNKAHESKDKERKLSAAQQPAGSGGGQQAAGPTQPSAPTVSYRAPSMAQSNNIVSGNSAPQPATNIIAVPVQIDASSLLGQNQQHTPPDNITQPPISGTEEKAKARAQKYLYEADKDLQDARDKQDVFGHKDDLLTEQPHTNTHDESKEHKGKE